MAIDDLDVPAGRWPSLGRRGQAVRQHSSAEASTPDALRELRREASTCRAVLRLLDGLVRPRLPELPFCRAGAAVGPRGPQRTQRRHHAAPAADACVPRRRRWRRSTTTAWARTTTWSSRSCLGARPRVARGLRPVAGALPLRSGWQAIDTAALYRVVCAVVRPRRAGPPGRRDARPRLDGGVHPAARVGRGAVRAGRRGRRPWPRVRADPRYVERVPHALAHPADRRVHHDRRRGGRPGRQRRPRPADVVARCLTELDSPGRPSHQKALAGHPGRPRAPRGRGARRPGPGPAAARHLPRDRHRGAAAAGPRPARDRGRRRGADRHRRRPPREEAAHRAAARAERGRGCAPAWATTRSAAALEILTESPDAALAGKARTALAKLGRTGARPGASTRAPAPPARRLWDLTLEPPTSPYPPVWGYAEPALLDRQRRESLLRGRPGPVRAQQPEPARRHPRPGGPGRPAARLRRGRLRPAGPPPGDAAASSRRGVPRRRAGRPPRRTSRSRGGHRLLGRRRGRARARAGRGRPRPAAAADARGRRRGRVARQRPA